MQKEWAWGVWEGPLSVPPGSSLTVLPASSSLVHVWGGGGCKNVLHVKKTERGKEW